MSATPSGYADPRDRFLLHDKVYLVTGGSRGLLKETYAMRRPGEPEEVIGVALYFASDASSWTTGAILRVDGGMP
ncbi:MAG: hypothetical protein QOJ66_2525 [Ilumatobacteraceae bacterium]|jgi:NAD(P)-dependent dehydrogenase (short-subunit alcohol dehydrogenase family)